MRSPLLICVLLLLWPPLARGENPARATPPHVAGSFLREQLGLDDDDLTAAVRGEGVVRMLPQPGGREFPVMGVVRLPGPPARWTEDWEGIVLLRGGSPDLLGIGRVSVPPRIEEFAGIDLEPRLAEQLRFCQRERCEYNVSADAIDRFRRETDWKGEGSLASVTAVFRDVLRDRVLQYQQHGDESLPVLANRRRVVTTADAPALLLARRPSLAQLAPGLEAHFAAWRSSPHVTPADFFYWCREKVWRREVVSLVHGVFHDDSGPDWRRRVLVEKTFYANQYFRGVLTVTGVNEDRTGVHLFLVSRTETDNGYDFTFIERAIANHLLKRRLSRQLQAMRQALSGAASPVSRQLP